MKTDPLSDFMLQLVSNLIQLSIEESRFKLVKKEYTLSQSVDRWTCVWKVVGSNPGLTNDQGSLLTSVSPTQQGSLAPILLGRRSNSTALRERPSEHFFVVTAGLKSSDRYTFPADLTLSINNEE